MEPFFSQSQLSVAFAIVKAAPQDMSMTEFGSHLHKTIRPNSSSNQSLPKRHIDSCEFWKDRYDSCLKDNIELRNKILAEQERRRVSARAFGDLGASDRSLSTRKRPRGMEGFQDWIDCDEGSDPTDLLADDYLLLSSYTIRIGRQRRELERMIKDPEMQEKLDTLLTATCKLLDLLDESMSVCLAPLSQLKCNGSEKVILLQQMMHQITIAYLAGFEVFNELAKTIPGRKKRFAVSNMLIKCFCTALAHLHTASTLQAGVEETQENRSRNKRLRIEAEEYAVNRYISRTLTQICQIDWKIGMPSHGEILEGILCSVLNQTGNLLSHVVFKEHVGSSDKVANISLNGPISPNFATAFEFHYIIPILHAALGGDARKEVVMQVLAESQQRSGRDTGLTGQTLLMVKKRMQEQLVKSALGSDAKGLVIPAPPEITEVYSPRANLEKKDESEWFLEAVWALVGWELAVQHGDG